jgi:hypothetical protein
MKRLLFLTMIIILTFAAGCIFSEDTKKNNEPEEVLPNESAEKYYPLKIGASWTYEAAVSKIGASDTTYTDTYAITDTVTYEGQPYFVEHREIGGYGTLSLYLRTGGNILYGTDPNQTGEELTYLNFNLFLGDSWTPSATQLEETFIAIVDVEVPAGIFENCIIFRAVGYQLENDIVVKNDIKEYYAANVGRVKSILMKTDVTETVVLSEVTVLKSYEIPE